jgi:hypothetical protein
MERFLQVFGAEVSIAYHTITQNAYGRSVAVVEVAEPHWFVHGMWLLYSHENKQGVLYVQEKTEGQPSRCVFSTKNQAM